MGRKPKKGTYVYVVYDERARTMTLEELADRSCVMLATEDKDDALAYAKENRGVVYQYKDAPILSSGELIN